MKHIKWQILFSVGLIALSVGLYFVHYLVFKNAHEMFFYILGETAFIPIHVLLVTIILHQLLVKREKRVMQEKLNMVIGAFFSEAGRDLLESFTKAAPCAHGIGKELLAITDWSAQDFALVAQKLKNCDCTIAVSQDHLQELQHFFRGKRNFLLRLLENPNLLEHDAFTELLWAVFHLAEELNHRIDLKNLPRTDYEHLANDMRRAYTLLTFEWLAYMKHLKHSYPYLFSLAMRTNPFNPSASIEVR